MLIRARDPEGRAEVLKRIGNGTLSPPGVLMGLKKIRTDLGLMRDPILLLGYEIERMWTTEYCIDPWSIYPIFLQRDCSSVRVSIFTWAELYLDWTVL